MVDKAKRKEKKKIHSIPEILAHKGTELIFRVLFFFFQG